MTMTSIPKRTTGQKIERLKIIPKKTRFTPFFIQKNGINLNRFSEWIFYPGMLFHSLNKWWGDQETRAGPHEGLDLCLYRDHENKIIHLGQKTKIPAIYDGVIVKIIDDFLGKSIFIEHRLSGFEANTLYTIYGHTIPHPDLSIEETVKQGDIIGVIVDANTSNANILTHLHISLGWACQRISYEQLNWEAISQQGVLTLLDPLEILDGEYCVLEENTINT